MNLCMVCGKIVSDLKYNFLYDYKYNVAIAFFKLELNNKVQIDLYAFDDVADEIYKRLKIGDYALFEGKIRTSGKLEIVWFEKLE